MRLLDLYCGAGGAAMGYHRAGFDEIVGVDINPQPNYPFEFVQVDALEYPTEGFDVIHASPPCQAFSQARDKGKEYPDLIKETRHRLTRSAGFYVIENVPNAPLKRQLMLCGTMFGLDVKRHRHFECSTLILAPQCNHSGEKRFPTLDWKRHGTLSRFVGVYGSTQFKGDFDLRCKAMGIDWMTNAEITQAIPPAYTEYIGKQLINRMEAIQ